MCELTENLILKVVSEIHDPVTTTDELIPSGETSSHRSNPLGLAEFALSRKDPAYVGLAKEVQKAEKVGSYLSVDTTIAKSGYIVVLDRIDTWMSIVLGILGLILLGLLMFGMYKLRLRRLARAAKKAEQKSTETEQVSDISEVAEVTEPEKTEHTHEE